MKAWDNFLSLQESELGSETVAKWLRPLKILKFDAGNIYLEAKDAFHAMWFEEHIRPKLQTRLFNNNSRRVKVHLTVAGTARELAKGPAPKGKGKKEELPKAPPFILSFDGLDPHCTFDRFVVSQSNELAYKLLQEITSETTATVAREQLAFNPVYLYGGTGTGKTHLLMATADFLRRRGRNVVYARAETFTQHVVSAIRAGEMPLFRQAYRNSDVLIIDDVHLFARKGATQEELFHTFNTLHVSGRQIILSAHCSPQELQLIEPRLVSRFEWGIVLPLEPSTEAELPRILATKAAALSFPINEKMTQFLLESFKSTKSLMRALEALLLRCHIHQREHLQKGGVNVGVARNLLADLIEEEKKGALTPNKIIQSVAEYYGIRVEDILSKAQSRDCVFPRQIAMFLCRQRLKMPYMQIGDLFARDHSTVMSSVKQVQKGVEANQAELVTAMNTIAKRF